MVLTSKMNGSPVSDKNRIHTRVNLQAERAKCPERQLLNFFCFSRVDVCRTNVLRSAAGLRIEKRILVVEIVKAALGNYFENRQGLITEDAYRQFAARYKFFYQ